LQDAVVSGFVVLGDVLAFDSSAFLARLSAWSGLETDRLLVRAQAAAAPLLGRSLSEAGGSSSTGYTHVTITLLTTGMTQSDTDTFMLNLSGVLSDPAAFAQIFGVSLVQVNQPPSMQTAVAPTVGLNTGGSGGDTSWLGGLFGSFGAVVGLLGLWVWYQNKRSSEARMSLMVEEASGRGRAPTLAKHSIRYGHSAGSELVAHQGLYGSQLSSAI
jgi:hypothetical protein